MADLTSLAVNLVIQTIVLAPVLWFAGKKIADPKDVKFTDAVWIVVLGNIIAALIGYFLGGFLGAGFLAAVINLLIWLMLVKHFFDTGWVKAVAISFITVILFIVIGIVLGFLGLGLMFLM